MAKRKKKQKKAKQPRDDHGDTKVMRLVHKILTQTIWPANLQLDEAVEVLTNVAKALVLSNTSDEDLEDRSEMIAWIEESFVTGLAAIDPFAEPAHAWIVPPQGSITEPVGIFWTGSFDDAEEGVQVMLGADLALLQAEIAANPAGVIVTEGVDGIAVIDPEWDGEPTITCANPQCGEVHDAHLKVAENLFQQAVDRRRQVTAAN
jgi:hypothetical protein